MGTPRPQTWGGAFALCLVLAGGCIGSRGVLGPFDDGVGGASGNVTVSSNDSVGPTTTTLSSSSTTTSTTTSITSTTVGVSSVGGGGPGAGGMGGAPPSGLTCGQQTCQVSDVCCYDDNTPNASYCAGSCPNQLIEISCMNPSDCPGEICCGLFDYVGNQQGYESIECHSTCEPSEFNLLGIVMCGNDPNVCGAGMSCLMSQVLPAGFNYCDQN